MPELLKRYSPPHDKLDLAEKGSICEVLLPDGRLKAIYTQICDEDNKAVWQFIDIIPINAIWDPVLGYTLSH